MMPRHKRRYRHWDAAEEQRAAQMRRDGVKTQQIAILLERSVESVNCKLEEIAVRSKNGDHLWVAILKEAKKLDAEQGYFTMSQLILTSWLVNKRLFGLKGYEQDYPCSYRIITNVIRKKTGLLSKGMLRTLDDGRYELTKKGSEWKE